VRRAGDFEVGIVTTVTEKFARVLMHGGRAVVLDRQFHSFHDLGIEPTFGQASSG